jgi:hypothetical protein
VDVLWNQEPKVQMRRRIVGPSKAQFDVDAMRCRDWTCRPIVNRLDTSGLLHPRGLCRVDATRRDQFHLQLAPQRSA